MTKEKKSELDVLNDCLILAAESKVGIRKKIVMVGKLLEAFKSIITKKND